MSRIFKFIQAVSLSQGSSLALLWWNAYIEIIKQLVLVMNDFTSSFLCSFEVKSQIGHIFILQDMCSLFLNPSLFPPFFLPDKKGIKIPLGEQWRKFLPNWNDFPEEFLQLAGIQHSFFSSFVSQNQPSFFQSHWSGISIHWVCFFWFWGTSIFRFWQWSPFSWRYLPPLSRSQMRQFKLMHASFIKHLSNPFKAEFKRPLKWLSWENSGWLLLWRRIMILPMPLQSVISHIARPSEITVVTRHLSCLL